MTLKDLLIKHEGLRLKPYRDTVGKLTIGVGRNLDDVGITATEALFLLDNDISSVIKACRETFSWFMLLDNVRQAVIVDMVFNMGIARFCGFKNTIEAIKAQDWEKAATEMLDSKWAKQVGNRATELAQMMREG